MVDLHFHGHFLFSLDIPLTLALPDPKFLLSFCFSCFFLMRSRQEPEEENLVPASSDEGL